MNATLTLVAPAPRGNALGAIAACAALGIALLSVLALGATAQGTALGMDLAVFALGMIFCLAVITGAAPAFLHWVMLPIASFGILVLAQWLCRWSFYPGATLNGLLQLFAYGAAFTLAFEGFRSPKWVRRFGSVLFLFCGGIAAEALLQYYTGNDRIYWFRDASYATPVGPFVYRGHYAGCIVLILPVAFAVSLTLRGKGVGAQLRWGLLWALPVITLVISQARGGLLAFGAEIVVAFALFYREILASRVARRRLTLAACLLAGAVLLATWGPVAARFASLGDHDASAAGRLELAEASFRMWRDHIWVGTGFNTFQQVYPRYERVDTGLIFTSGHSDFAQTLAETGLSGMAMVVAFLVFLLAAGRKLWQDRSRAPAIIIKLGVFVGLLGFTAYSVIDFQFHAPANAMLYFILAGVLFAPLESERHPLPLGFSKLDVK